MLSKKEIRFIEFWKEQREGSAVKYYLLYTIAWGLLIVFGLFFGLILIGKISMIPIPADNPKIAVILAVGFPAGFLCTWLIRSRNEKLYRKLLDKVKKN